MDHEKKHQEDLEAAKGWLAIAKENGNKIAIQIIEDLFPELKDSEDEKIWKVVKEYINQHYPVGSPVMYKSKILNWLEKQKPIKLNHDDEKLRNAAIDACKYIVDNFENSTKQYEDAIAWLENQVVQNKWKPSKDEMDALYGLAYITNEMDDKKDKAITKLYQDLKREFFKGASYENMFPSSQIEPKFRVGDWITNGIDFTFKVTSIKDDMYCRDDDYLIDIETADKTFRLWTIQDAKDGDVLVNDNDIFVFDGTLEEKRFPFAYCGISNGDFGIYNRNIPFTHNRDIYPATKEKRDILFSKMKEAGYVWDGEKKELKKIEHKSSWSGEDERLLSKLQSYVEIECFDRDYNGDELLDWLRSLKNRVQSKKEWSEEDEKGLDDALWCCKQAEMASIAKDENDMGDAWYAEYWLKSLKDRVQLRKEWSGEDELALKQAIYVCHQNGYTAVEDWLKSLKPQNHWKPSEEQMEALKFAANDYCMGEIKKNLESLYNDLKNL